MGLEPADLLYLPGKSFRGRWVACAGQLRHRWIYSSRHPSDQLVPRPGSFFDVFAWREPGEVRFDEAKVGRRDSIRPSQRRFVKLALDSTTA